MDFLADIRWAFLPELIIITFIFISAFLSLFFNKKLYKTSQWIAISGILTSFASIGFVQAEPTYFAFNGSVVCNVYTVFFKSLILIASFFVILLSKEIVKKKREKAFEYFALLYGAILGSLLMVGANDFLVAYFAFALLGITSTLLIGVPQKYNTKIASTKFLLTEIFASSIFLLGVSYLYIVVGQMNFDSIFSALSGYQGGLLLALALIFIVTGIMFKICATPFANYAPDIYKDTTAPVGTFLSLIPIITGFSLLSRILLLTSDFVPLVGVVVLIYALITMSVGVYGAITQNNIKSFMGYSTMIQVSFMLLVLGVIKPYTLSALLYYLVSYIFMNIALWAAVINYNKNNISDYTGLAYKRPFYTLAVIFTLLSMIGFPPTSGFLAKLFVMSAVTRLGIIYLVFILIMLLLTVVAFFAYLKLINTMFKKIPNPIIEQERPVFSKITLYFCSGITILLCFYSSKIIELCELISYSL